MFLQQRERERERERERREREREREREKQGYGEFTEPKIMRLCMLIQSKTQWCAFLYNLIHIQ